MFNFTLPTKIRMGENVILEIGREAKQFGDNVLIITDKGITNSGVLHPVINSLEKENVRYFIFDEVVSNPSVQNVEDGVQAFRNNDCKVIIAVGGGSPIDTAKAVGVVVANGKTIRDYEGFNRFTKRAIPLLTVPTTVGTGSEVTKGAVISDPDRNAKMVIASDLMYPVTAYLDKQMVKSLPGHICAATGIDTLTHAIEGYIATGATPISDALNLHAIRMVQKHLRPAVAGSEEDLYQMLVAACIAGAGFHNSGLGLVHAIANTVGGHFPVHHGVANAIILPHVMKFNLIANVDKFADIAEALGVRCENLPKRDAAQKAIDEVLKLIDDVQVPKRLRDVGVKEDAIETIAKETLDAVDRPTNPRKNNVEDIEKIIRAAF